MSFHMLKRIVIFILLLVISSQTFAAKMNDSQKAMNIAESITKGKAIGAKLIQKGDQKGYKVRIMKQGKVSHVFISLQQL